MLFIVYYIGSDTGRGIPYRPALLPILTFHGGNKEMDQETDEKFTYIIINPALTKDHLIWGAGLMGKTRTKENTKENPNPTLIRQEILESLEAGDSIIIGLQYWNEKGQPDYKWFKEEPLFIVEIEETKYIKAVNDSLPQDNLGRYAQEAESLL
jgi:hypothetical protein